MAYHKQWITYLKSNAIQNWEYHGCRGWFLQYGPHYYDEDCYLHLKGHLKELVAPPSHCHPVD